MNERDHFVKFRNKHEMSVAQNIERPFLTEPNGQRAAAKLQGSVHLPEKLPWRMRLREHVKKAWGYIVVSKADGRYSISQPFALAILGFILTFGGAWYWRSSEKIQNQHDEIIQLRTRLDLEKEKNLDQDSKIDQARATAQIADKNAARLEGKFDQFALQYTIANPKQPQPFKE